MSMVSYAQNHEDVLLDRAFPRGRPGFYIDVGANEPVVDSVTKHFYDLGWHGINVEPGQAPFAKLVVERPRDINLNVAVSDHAGEVTLYELPPRASVGSTVVPQNAARQAEVGNPATQRSVPAVTLAEICADHVPGPIDFLSVDVEGHEREVLLGGDWTTYRPRVVLIEATEPTTNIPSHEAWEPILIEAGYGFAGFDGINRYYVRKEDADLMPAFSVPVNILDNYVPYAWSKRLTDVAGSAEQASRELAAARALYASLLQEYHGFAHEISLMRARYEKLERRWTTTRADYEVLRALALEGEAAAPASVDGVIEGASPTSIAVARRLTGMAARHPKAADGAKKALRLGLELRRGIAGRDR
jgi:FkbM family methyltransferase